MAWTDWWSEAAALINSSFRAKRSVDPESSCLFSNCYWVPAYAGMTKDELVRPFLIKSNSL